MPLKKSFSKFLNYAVIVVLFFLCIMPVLCIAYFVIKSSNIILTIMVIAFYLLAVIFYKRYGCKIKIHINYDRKRTILYILTIALIVRVLWIILVPTQPGSDFSLMYNFGRDAAQGKYDLFKGTNYFARFTHDTVTVLYFSLFYHITRSPLILVKVFNIIYGIASIFLLYLIINEIMGKKSAVIGAAMLSLFPPYVMYTSETMSENMAYPFYMLSIYLFIKAAKKDKKIIYLLLCGLTLSIGNMFRMVGAVFLIAYIVYLLVYRGIKECIKSSFIIGTSYALLIFLVSSSLLNAKITERHLWQPKEPAITSVLKGTNMEHFGMWNEEDAKLPKSLKYDAVKIKEASKEIIIERLTKTPIYKTAFHYVVKLCAQWGIGDYDAYRWTVQEAYNTPLTKLMKSARTEINVLINLIYLTLLIRAFSAMRNKEYKGYEDMNFFFILFGGFVLLYLITEMQTRYSFIALWLIVMFAIKKPPEHVY